MSDKLRQEEVDMWFMNRVWSTNFVVEFALLLSVIVFGGNVYAADDALPQWIDVLTDRQAETDRRMDMLAKIKAAGTGMMDKLAEHDGALEALSELVREDPSGYIRGHVANTLGRLDPDGEHVGAVLVDALKHDPEREVVPMGTNNLLLQTVREVGDLDVALPALSRDGEVGEVVQYPLIFRNAGNDVLTVRLQNKTTGSELMNTAVTRRRFELVAGEAVTSFVNVTIGDGVSRGQHEQQRLQISVNDGSSQTDLVFNTARTTVLDNVDIGDSASERAHNFTETGSERRQEDEEALGEAGRRLRGRVDMEADLHLEKWWHGGWMAFDVEVDPGKQNYVTIKVWGSERTRAGLGLMIGSGGEENDYRWITSPKKPGHDSYEDFKLADAIWEPKWTNSNGAPYPGRWVYRTYPVPAKLTEGKSQVRLRLQQISVKRSKSWNSPTVYAAYTHTGPHFIPPNDEEQGEPFVWGKVREKSEEFTLEHLKTAADEYVQAVIDGEKKPMFRGILGGTLVPQVYYREWSDHYKDEGIVQRAAKEIDAKARTFAEKGRVGGRWAKSGSTIARTYTYLHEAFTHLGLLDETVDFGGDIGKATRREAYAAMFKGEFERFRYRDRSYTNQGFRMGRGCYYLNRALQQLAPEAAIPKEQARWYIYEIFGVVPWGVGKKARPLDGKRIKRMLGGTPFFQTTDKGFTAEYGYVGGYGEMTRKYARLAQDLGWPSLKERVEQTVKARSHVRIPSNTEDGYRTLRSIDVFSGRFREYPAKKGMYGAGDALLEAAVLQDPVSVRLAELYLQHHGKFKTNGSARRYENYKTFKQLPPSDYRLPIEPGHDDYAWGDEQTGLFMIRHDAELVYGVFYFKNRKERWGKDDARLRHVTPQTDRVVDLKVEGHEGGGAHPLTDLPPSYPNAAREAWFYQVKYGNLLIGMNTTTKNNYTASLHELEVPEEHQGKTVKDLVSGRMVDLSDPVILPPRTTMVLDLGEN